MLKAATAMRPDQEAKVPKALMLMTMAAPDLAELCVRAGYYAIILDLEHGFPADATVIRQMVVACSVAGGECWIRLPVERVEQVGPLADLGIHGIVLSQARSLDDLLRLSDAASFPPDGHRSINPFVPAAGNPGDMPTLVQSVGQLRLWIMGETRELTERILGRESSDEKGLGNGGVLIGPYDLAGALGCDANPHDPTLRAAIDGYISLAERSGSDWALFVRDSASLGLWYDAGIFPPWIVFGVDRDIWFQVCRRRVARLGAQD